MPITGPIWTKRAKLEGRLDPLGLDRPSDRLTSELIPGVTVNVNLARYFSFFPWVFTALQGSTEDAQYQEVLRAEKAYALSALLAHNGEHCSTGIAGSELVGPEWNIKQQCNLDRLRWFSNGGVYANLYKGPLFKLGLLKTELVEKTEKTTVTGIGRPLVSAFARTVNGTALATRGFSRSSVSRNELEEFGQRACPCSLQDRPDEREALRHLFFETDTLEGRMLANTLGLILSVIQQCESFTDWQLETQFRMAMFYRQIYNNTDRPVSVRVLPKLEGIWAEWRMFQAHDYFSFALETLLTVWLEALEIAPGQCLTLEQFLTEMDTPIFVRALADALEIQAPTAKLSTLRLSTLIRALPRQSASGIINSQSSEAFDSEIQLEHRLAEQTLVDSVWEQHKAGGPPAERCAKALVLLLILYVRFYRADLQGERHRGWWRYKAASSQTRSDLGLPRFCAWYPPDTLCNYSVHDWLAQLMSAHVIRQALEIRDERGGKAIWFMDAGLAGMGALSPFKQTCRFQYPFENYRTFRNTSKLGNAVTLVRDIGYIEQKNNWVLTADGQERLQRQFGD